MHPPSGPTIEPVGGGFRLVLADGFGEPAASTSPVPMGDSNLTMHMFTTTRGSSELLAAAYIDYPESLLAVDPAEILDAAEKHALANIDRVRVTTRREISVDGFPGRSITFTGMNGSTKLYCRADFYSAKRQIFIVIYVAEKAAILAKPDVGRMFGSFALTDVHTAKAVPANSDEYVSEDGGYAVTFPIGFSAPATQDVPLPTELGQLTMKVVTTTKGADQIFMTAYVDFPDSAFAAGPGVMLDGAEKGAMNNLHGKVTTRESISIDGNPGRSITFSGKSSGTKVYGRVDYYLVKPRLYQILYISPDKAKVSKDVVKATFSTFRLTR